MGFVHVLDHVRLRNVINLSSANPNLQVFYMDYIHDHDCQLFTRRCAILLRTTTLSTTTNVPNPKPLSHLVVRPQAVGARGTGRSVIEGIGLIDIAHTPGDNHQKIGHFLLLGEEPIEIAESRFQIFRLSENDIWGGNILLDSQQRHLTTQKYLR